MRGGLVMGEKRVYPGSTREEVVEAIADAFPEFLHTHEHGREDFIYGMMVVDRLFFETIYHHILPLAKLGRSVEKADSEATS